MSTLSEEELACFNELFSPQVACVDSHLAAQTSHEDDVEPENHYLSVATEIPQVLTKILGGSKLTLLAEFKHYRLWFPLVLHRDELGQFIPKLGVPEVLDTRGSERSWRVDNLQNVKVIDDLSQQSVEVLSLSSSGLTMKLPSGVTACSVKPVKLLLPNDQEIEMDFETVRAEEDVVAARINVADESRETLRQFLFSQHKAKYAHLYKF
ncbi:PilZ domain-containing protein [Shewanella maritima]|uniref:PilZ domain-containing protein n=1 Tax=Shewanella maritima TaxID=2520507 RepID=UPI0037368685